MQLRRFAAVTLAVSAAFVAVRPPLTAQASASPFSIEQVQSYGFPTDLVVSPAGDRIAWLENREGVRNVMGAEAPDWSPRMLTRYAEDDGQELAGLAFLAGGQRLIYLRGSGTNMDGEVANPTSDIEGSSRDLWTVPWSGGAPARLAGPVSPVPSPTDSRVVWSDDGEAWMVDGDHPGGEPERVFQVRGGLSGLAWSPDGRHLAFSSARDGRSILGVFDTRDRALRWLTNTVDSDRLPRWSPDGARIAFIRDVQGFPGYAVWSLDVASGASMELWHSPREPGVNSGYPRSVSGEYDMVYGDGFIVVPGEWEGWNHLYAIPETGGDARPLTPGEGIVENAALSADGLWMWVSANTRSIDYRQLGRIRLADGHAEWLVDGDQIAWNPAPSSDGAWIAYIRSDHAEPASVYVHRIGAGSGDRVSEIPEAFPADRLVKPEQVIFETEDGWTIHAQLFLPPEHREGQRHPGVLFMHGGSRRQMMLGWHNRGYYHGAYGFTQYLASQGYAVLSVNYRSGIGYGVDFRNPPNYGRQGASEYQDILDAGRWLQQHPAVDPDRIGLWGGSYGGYLTALGLARDSDLFKAGVDLHGVHDWWQQSTWYGRRTGGRFGGQVNEEARRTMFEASPVADIDTWTSPVLIVHGDDDRNVPFEASIDLVRRLRQKGDVHFEELYFIDDIHGFYRHANWLATFNAAADFFDRMLMERAAVSTER